MPHQCVRCSTLYDDSNTDIIFKGCKCGSRMFFFIRKKLLEKKKKIVVELTPKEKEQIENDVYEILGEEKETPVILDIETINVVKPGKFEIDLVNLFNKKNPIVYKLEEGKYVIDLAESFKRNKEFLEEIN